jgi:hypothetical protein
MNEDTRALWTAIELIGGYLLFTVKSQSVAIKELTKEIGALTTLMSIRDRLETARSAGANEETLTGMRNEISKLTQQLHSECGPASQRRLDEISRDETLLDQIESILEQLKKQLDQNKSPGGEAGA